MALENIFSEENLLSYAQACLDLAVEVPETHFDTLIIPSRGAVPIFLGMLHALPKLSWNPQHQYFYEGLGVQSLVSPLLPENTGLENQLDNKRVRVLLLPFTADLNIIEKTEEETLEYTERTRQYWARVAASFMLNPQARMKDPFFNTFTETILREIEGRGSLAEDYERFPRAERTAMIDTVISGRAARDILNAFDRIAKKHYSGVEKIGDAATESLIPHAFLLIDEEGRKLKQPFSTYLHRKIATGQVRRYFIKRIVSEDEGANLEGVAAVVYPSIMESSRNLLRGNEEFFIGAGSWHIGPESPYLNNFKRFMNLLYRAIDTVYAKDFEGNGKELDKFREAREDFVKRARQSHLLASHDEDPSVLNLNKTPEIQRAYETGSHVMHISFSPDSTSRLIEGVISRNIYSQTPISHKKNNH